MLAQVHTPMCAGYFQPEAAQFSCISCDSLGDFYQELQGQSSCLSCVEGTQSYVGVLTAENKSACQCKQGDVSIRLALSYIKLNGCNYDVQAITPNMAGPARCARVPQLFLPATFAGLAEFPLGLSAFASVAPACQTANGLSGCRRARNVRSSRSSRFGTVAVS